MLMTENPIQILYESYPDRSEFFDRLDTLATLKPRDESIPNAVLRTVVGQMLSSTAARTIYSRLVDRARTKESVETWVLSPEEMRECGLSRSKCRTVVEFRERYLQNPDSIEAWPTLSFEELQNEVNSYWGMSNWTASIISLFYFGNEDVFPREDGSIQTSLRLLKDQFPSKSRSNKEIDPDGCRPYRSYLALALWKGLDDGVLTRC